MNNEELMPMDQMEGAEHTPASETVHDPAPQSERARDESGRFAPKDGEGPRGAPNDEIARRRYAQERDEARKDAEEARAAHAALQKRLDDMATLAKGDDPAAPKEPVDPLQPVLEKLETFEKRFSDQDEAKQAEETHRQVLAYSDQDEAKFREKAPDFQQAAEHYILSRMNEMKVLGVDQQRAEALLAQEANQLLYRCAQEGRSAAESLYAMAQARGYVSGAAGQRPAPASPQPQNFGGRSLGSGQGPAGGAVTAAQIAAMSEDDYMAFRSTPEGKRAISRAMGA
ncbi:hypothetical protein SAMN02927924_01426 [Sphingobium faniae]|nr:hypothetical protein SAMN02927924_01426 [Sphingobium faniae]